MTPEQKTAVRGLLDASQSAPQSVHHGDCVGADTDIHIIASALGLQTVVHPPVNESKRAFCKATEIRPPDEYLARNRCIVDESSLLIATPAEVEEQQRGGTWYTVRYARSVHKPIVVIWPDGGISVEDPGSAISC